MTLVDTSIWVNHFRKRDLRLQTLLEGGEVLVHPCVIGELACGNLRRRTVLLQLLKKMPAAPVARDGEVLDLIERRRLWGQGIGWIDAHLLASSLLSGSRLWTADRRLKSLAEELGRPGDRL